MKRCPEAGRDSYDETLLYCLDDGSARLEGPASVQEKFDEPRTACLHGSIASSGSPAPSQFHTTNGPAMVRVLEEIRDAPTTARENSIFAGIPGFVLVTGLGVGIFQGGPFKDQLRDDPRFGGVLKRLNLSR